MLAKIIAKMFGPKPMQYHEQRRVPPGIALLIIILACINTDSNRTFRRQIPNIQTTLRLL